MNEFPERFHPSEELDPEELLQANRYNTTELNRRSKTRILIVEKTKVSPDTSRLDIWYGDMGLTLPSEAKDQVKPGTRILIDQQSDYSISRVKGVYVLGENLMEPSPDKKVPHSPQTGEK